MTLDRTLPPPSEKPWFTCSREGCENKFQPYHGKVGCLCDECHSNRDNDDVLSSSQLATLTLLETLHREYNRLVSVANSLLLAVIFTCAILFAFTAYNSFYPVCEMLPMNLWEEREWRITTGSIIILFILFYFGD